MVSFNLINLGWLQAKAKIQTNFKKWTKIAEAICYKNMLLSGTTAPKYERRAYLKRCARAIFTDSCFCDHYSI